MFWMLWLGQLLHWVLLSHHRHHESWGQAKLQHWQHLQKMQEGEEEGEDLGGRGGAITSSSSELGINIAASMASFSGRAGG